MALSGCVLALSGCILALSGCVLVGLAITLFKLYTNFVCLFSSLQPCRMNINPTKGLYHYTSLLTTLKSHSLCNTEAIQHFRLRYWHAFCRSRYPVFLVVEIISYRYCEGIKGITALRYPTRYTSLFITSRSQSVCNTRVVECLISSHSSARLGS